MRHGWPRCTGLPEEADPTSPAPTPHSTALSTPFAAATRIVTTTNAVAVAEAGTASWQYPNDGCTAATTLADDNQQAIANTQLTRTARQGAMLERLTVTCHFLLGHVASSAISHTLSTTGEEAHCYTVLLPLPTPFPQAAGVISD